MGMKGRRSVWGSGRELKKKEEKKYKKREVEKIENLTKEKQKQFCLVAPELLL